MAHAFRIPYASHGHGPVELNVMACLPNALYLDTGLIHPGSPLKLEDGVSDYPPGLQRPVQHRLDRGLRLEADGRGA